MEVTKRPKTPNKLHEKGEEKDSEMNSASNDHFQKLPNEVLQHILSYILSYEEIDKLKLINHRFNDTCKYLLTIGYRQVEKEVRLRLEKAKMHSSNPKCGFLLCSYCMDHILWHFVEDFLTNSFCLFDIWKGYLEKKYFIDGKTIDVVRRLLGYKGNKNPLGLSTSVLPDREGIYVTTFIFKMNYPYVFDHLRGKGSFHAPVIEGSDAPSEELLFDLIARPYKFKQLFAAMVLDLLSYMWTKGVTGADKERLLSKDDLKRKAGFACIKFIYVAKPGQGTDVE